MGLPSGARSWLSMIDGFANEGSDGGFLRHPSETQATAAARTTILPIRM
jgi:hypothetical protein